MNYQFRITQLLTSKGSNFKSPFDGEMARPEFDEGLSGRSEPQSGDNSEASQATSCVRPFMRFFLLPVRDYFKSYSHITGEMAEWSFRAATRRHKRSVQATLRSTTKFIFLIACEGLLSTVRITTHTLPERWLSGRKQRFAKSSNPKRVPGVRIPLSPPLSKTCDSSRFFYGYVCGFPCLVADVSR